MELTILVAIVSYLEQSFLSLNVLWKISVTLNVILVLLFDILEVTCVQTIITQNRLKLLHILECW